MYLEYSYIILQVSMNLIEVLLFTFIFIYFFFLLFFKIVIWTGKNIWILGELAWNDSIVQLESSRALDQ